jgi:ribosome biogenesis protein MAK21
MARKSKDPRKPSQAYLAATGQLKPVTTETDASPATPVKTQPTTPSSSTSTKPAAGAKSTPVKKAVIAPTTKSKSKSTENEDVLRREIKALGGDDEDWEMLKDLSDSEGEEPQVEVEKTKKTAKDKTLPGSSALEVSRIVPIPVSIGRSRT